MKIKKHQLRVITNLIESIYNELINNTADNVRCDIGKCSMYSRNNRERETVNIECKDKKLSMFIDILDTIHCYFIHSVDVGFRIIQPITNNDKEKKEDDYISSENTAYDHDQEMKEMRIYLSSKRKRLQNLRGDRRLKNTKFTTQIPS